MELEIKILNKFKETIVGFLDSLIEQVDEYPEIKGDLITLRVFSKDQLPVENIVNSFILHLIPHKEMIVERKDVFFMEHIDRFTNIPRDSINRFKMLWRSNTFTTEDRDAIWKWIDVLLKIVERYQSVKIRSAVS